MWSSHPNHPAEVYIHRKEEEKKEKKPMLGDLDLGEVGLYPKREENSDKDSNGLHNA